MGRTVGGYFGRLTGALRPDSGRCRGRATAKSGRFYRCTQPPVVFRGKATACPRHL